MEDRWDAPTPTMPDARPDAMGPLAYASWSRRILGALVDVFVLSLVTVPLVQGQITRFMDATAHNHNAAASDVSYVTLVTLLLQVGYFTGMHAWRGSTIGKMAVRTAVVRSDGSKVTPPTAFVRAVTLVAINFVSGFLFLAPMAVNMLRPLWHPQRQTWHDQVAGTVVVLAASIDTESLPPS